MILLAAFVTFILIGMLTIALVNMLTFPKLVAPPSTNHIDIPPLVSILIPARDESAVIEKTVKSLLAQTYARFELIVLDDHSRDATAAVARAAGYGDARLRVVSGQPLPANWLGKNWACHQLAQEAKGEWLFFTDADVSWQPEALAALVDQIDRTQADVITVWPTQHSHTWPERLVVPMMALAIIGYLPVLLVHHAPYSSLAAANGQCLAFRRRAYQIIGGHTTVQNQVLEDVILARHTKAHQLALRMVDGNQLITCRMYQNWAEVRAGFAKNILSGYGNSIPLLIAGAIFHLTIFVWPWLWLAFGWAGEATYWPLWPLLLVGLGVGLRAITAVVTRQRIADAWLMPISALLMTWIAGQSIWWQVRYGGPRWKGRTITRDPLSARGTNG